MGVSSLLPPCEIRGSNWDVRDTCECPHSICFRDFPVSSKTFHVFICLLGQEPHATSPLWMSEDSFRGWSSPTLWVLGIIGLVAGSFTCQTISPVHLTVLFVLKPGFSVALNVKHNICTTRYGTRAGNRAGDTRTQTDKDTGCQLYCVPGKLT